jgi:hypothetical protein
VRDKPPDGNVKLKERSEGAMRGMTMQAARKAGQRRMPALSNQRHAELQMNEPRKKNPTFGIAVLIVVVVSLVIATVLYNAISGKREFDRETAADGASAAASAPAQASAADAAGASGSAAQ